MNCLLATVLLIALIIIIIHSCVAQIAPNTNSSVSFLSPSFKNSTQWAKFVDKLNQQQNNEQSLSGERDPCKETPHFRKLRSDIYVKFDRFKSIIQPKSSNPIGAVQFNSKLIRHCRRFIFHPNCNMSVALQGTNLYSWQIDLFQHWTDQYNEIMKSHSWDSSNSSPIMTRISAEIQRADRLFSCVHSSYFAASFPLRECLLKLIDSGYQIVQSRPKSRPTLKVVLSLKSKKNVDPCFSESTTTTTMTNPFTTTVHTIVPIDPADHCLRNPNQCPMNVTLQGLGFETEQIKLLQEWLDQFLFHAKSEANDSSDPSKREQMDYEMARAFEMLACIRSSRRESAQTKHCLLRILSQHQSH